MSKGINTQHLDLTTAPGEDFYAFVNGTWLAKTEIPSDRSSWGSFHELDRETDEKVLTILEAELNIKGPSGNIAGRLFESGMNTQQTEKARLEVLNEMFDLVEDLHDPLQLPSIAGKMMPKAIGIFINFSVHPDLGNSKIYAAYLEPSSLGLPERDFYLDDDEKATLIRGQYLHYIEAVLVEELKMDLLLAQETSKKILALERQLAEVIMSKEDRRQLDKLYNPYTPDQLINEFPDWDWKEYFKSMGVTMPQRMIVTDKEYTRAFFHLLTKQKPETLRHYLLFLLIHQSAPYAHASLEQLHFNLFGKTLEGVETMRPRKERIIKVVNNLLGEALGQLFVSKHFPPQAKESAIEMTNDIVLAYKNRIAELTWMSEATKTYALEKLDSFKVKIGYPEKWKDYDGLEIESTQKGNYLSNLLAVVEWKFRKDIKRIDQGVDREEWFLAPQVVNAYYNPMFNEIVFPAAILQPPFFDWEADAAVNYGGIGAVIGHEITHGFDDQGSRFDKEGNLNEWWTEEDRVRFQELTQKLVDQFDAYFPFEDLPLNGTFTLGENIADLGGLSVAYDALQLYYKRHGKPEPVDGFTADQRFFMSWATVWRTKTRPEAMRTQIKTDPHPPGAYRAIAAPSNLQSFYEAFEIYPHSPWYRKEEERIKIW